MPWAAQQTKVRSKLAIQRIRTLIDKNAALAKRQRREVASLLESGKIETARLRTESLIQQDQHNELLELLELYVELILARFGLLEMNPKEKEPDEGVREAVCSIVYAAPRTEVRELHIIREAFMSRYGREWAIGCMENTHGHVSPRVLSKCKLETPAKDWVDLYLYEISKAYQINWRPEGLEVDRDAIDGGAQPDTAAQEQRLLEVELSSSARNNNSHEKDDDSGGDVVSDLPSTPSAVPHLTEVRNSTTSIPIIKQNEIQQDINANPHKPGDIFDLPAIPPSDPSQSARTVLIKSNLGSSPNSKTVTNSTSAQTKSADTTYEDLAKRFAALKRR